MQGMGGGGGGMINPGYAQIEPYQQQMGYGGGMMPQMQDFMQGMMGGMGGYGWPEQNMGGYGGGYDPYGGMGFDPNMMGQAMMGYF